MPARCSLPPARLGGGRWQLSRCCPRAKEAIESCAAAGGGDPGTVRPHAARITASAPKGPASPWIARLFTVRSAAWRDQKTPRALPQPR